MEAGVCWSSDTELWCRDIEEDSALCGGEPVTSCSPYISYISSLNEAHSRLESRGVPEVTIRLCPGS